MGSDTLHLLDSRNVHAAAGVTLKLGLVQKSSANPLFSEDRPWESSGDNMYPNVLIDPRDGLYKLWYTPFTDLSQHKAQSLCYAVSTDGIRWEKPELGLTEFRGSKANNMLLPFISGAGVAIDERATNPDERFKMTYLVHPELAPEWAKELRAQGHPLPRRGAGVGYSADGIHWKLRPDNPVLPGIAGDTHNHWLWCEESRKHVLLTRANVPFLDGKPRPAAERVVKRWESDDFIHWTNGTIVFRAEGDEIERRHYYSMPSFRHGNGYLGLLALLNADPADDTVDCELAWSPDTIHWERICRGESFIPRGAAGSYDAGCIYAGWWPVLVGEELRIYYAGSRGKHGSGARRQSSFLLATIPRDRYAGLEARASGEITTRAMELGRVDDSSGEHSPRALFLNADARGGNIIAEVQDTQGRPIPGYEFQNCRPVSADGVALPVTWKSHPDLREVKAGACRISFRLTRATIYAIHR